jgi:predicted HTH transcriptional regulator
LTLDEIMANESIHRNKIVAQCLRDYQAGQRMDLALVKDLRIMNG